MDKRLTLLPAPGNGAALAASLLLAFGANAADAPTQLAYAGRVVPPMTAPKLPDIEEPAPPKRIWPHALPFFAQQVIDRGYDLPNPYFAGTSLYLSREERVLSDLEVGFNGGPPIDASFVHFRKAEIDNVAPQLQAGAWIFPFLNAYAIVGRTKGGGDIDIEIPGKDLMDFLGVPGCGLPPAAQPAICSQVLAGTAEANYHGTTYGVGMTVAGAHRNFFFALPVTYVISDITMSTTKGKTWNFAPRLGYNQHLADGGMLTWYAGGTYLRSSIRITGEFEFDTSSSPIGRVTSMSYSIRAQPKDRWNYLAGVNWTITKAWSVMGEVGFGNTRDDVLFTAFYRW